MSGSVTAISTPITYDFDNDCQSEIVKCLAFDTDFHRQSDNLIESAYFQNTAEQIIADLAIKHYKRYREVPSNTAWTEILKDQIKSGRIKAGDAREVVTKLTEIDKLDVRNRAWLLDKVAEFAKHQAVMNAMMVAAKAISKHTDLERFDKIEDVMKKAFSIKLNEESDDYDYFEKIEERTQQREDIMSGKIPPRGITTGIPELNDLLYHRGWGREELSLLMGGAKASKSFHLTMFAAHAVLSGKNVLFITLENSIEITANRIDAQMSDIGLDVQTAKPVAVEMAVKAKAINAGKLKIRNAPMGTLTPVKVQTWIDEYKTKGLVFDLVVIDYWDIMAPTIRDKDKIENSASIGRELRAMAQKEKLALLTATQANREGHKSAVLKAEHVAEDFNRIRIADVALAISRTDEEKAHSKARITFAACRNQPDGATLFLIQDLNRGLAISEVESVE